MRRKYLLAIVCALLCSCGGKKYAVDDQQLQVAIDRHAEKTVQELGLSFVLTGTFMDKATARYSIGFVSNKCMSIDQARPMGIKIVSEFLQMLKNSPASLNNIGVCVIFWDKDMKYITEPYLAEILFFDGQFHYYEADAKTQELRLVHTENY